MLTAQYTPELSVNDSPVLSHDMVNSAITERDADALYVYSVECRRVGATVLANMLLAMSDRAYADARSERLSSFERGMTFVSAEIGDL